MRKLIVISIFLIVGVNVVTAQYYEIGGFAGLSNYFGDLQASNMEPTEFNLAYGLFGRINLNRHLSGKIGFTRGQISGDDYNSDTVSGRRQRNLSFRSKIYELAFTGEYNFIPYDIRDNKIAAFYVFGGVSVFHFNPTAEFEGKVYYLNKLGTEGQRMDGSSIKPYSLFQLAIPMGLGTKFNLNQRSNIGIEVGFRKTFTDYLDDVSTVYPDVEAIKDVDPIAAALSYRAPEFYEVNQKDLGNPEGKSRGNPAKMDWFFFMGATLSVNLGSEEDMEYTNRNKYFMMSF
jgi:hypothetical protein